MASLADILELSNPRPKSLDPEDDINVETAACVVERFDEGSVIQSEVSSLRQKNVPLLEDVDARYVGKRISRKAFDQSYEAGSESSSESEESEDDAEFNESLNSFNKQIRKLTALQASYDEHMEGSRPSEEEGSFSSGLDEEGDVESGEEEKTIVFSDEDMFKKFSHIDVNEEIEKGKAVEAQLSLWNKFCECRIRFQKILIAANKFPQFDTWNDFKMKGDKNYSDALERGPVDLMSLLDSMLALQSQLHLSNPETKSFFATADILPAQESDENLLDGSESESKNTIAGSKKYIPKKKSIKRKLKLDEYGDILAKRFKTFIPYRNSVVQKWDDKTNFTFGKIKQKSFSAFNQPTLKQIEQILQDKHRLIRRTQLRRSVHSILGKNEVENTTCKTEAENDVKEHSDEHLNQHDPEIFDDDDFYRSLLKDVIESKTVGMDPDLLRTHLEIQKNRRKMKKKTDTKASKGRKLRYDPHPKMVSFMAGVPYSASYSEGTRNDLFKRLFNQSPAILTL